MSQMLSTIVQRQYAEFDEVTIYNDAKGIHEEKTDKDELDQHQKNQKLLHLGQLNPLRHAIVRFFDGLLRLTQCKLQLLEKEQEDEKGNDVSMKTDSVILSDSAFSREATFWRATSEHQDLYTSSAALMLSFPDDRNCPQSYPQNNDSGSIQNSTAERSMEEDDHLDDEYYPHAVPAAVKIMLRLQLEELELDEEERFSS
mmetsp:Transcript_26907/g.63054  ORF Transcript_26907/g.63054 Transcript_26907/m.63054 type:complete len:200 (-) Transcript_26907:88-687(-)